MFSFGGQSCISHFCSWCSVIVKPFPLISYSTRSHSTNQLCFSHFQTSPYFILNPIYSLTFLMTQAKFRGFLLSVYFLRVDLFFSFLFWHTSCVLSKHIRIFFFQSLLQGSVSYVATCPILQFWLPQKCLSAMASLRCFWNQTRLGLMNLGFYATCMGPIGLNVIHCSQLTIIF